MAGVMWRMEHCVRYRFLVGDRYRLEDRMLPGVALEVIRVVGSGAVSVHLDEGLRVDWYLRLCRETMSTFTEGLYRGR